MHRISTGFSMIALMATLGCMSIPRGDEPGIAQVALHKPDFSASGVDAMPVGTAKQIARLKRNRAERKV